MTKDTKVDVHFKITGTELDADTGYDLYYLSESMKLFHQLIEKTYLTLKSEKHMSKAKREDLKIKVFNIRDGSFEADFCLIINQVIPSLLTMVSTLDAKNVWELAKLSYDYLLTILKANREGKSVTLKEVSAENSQVVVGNNNVILNVHPDVVLTARTTYPVYKKIANIIDDKEKTLDNVTFSDKEKEGKNIRIGVEEKLLLQNENVVHEDPVEFVGEIFNADGYKFTGKLKVIESNDLPQGEYNFDFFDSKNKTMKDYFETKHNFVAVKVTSFNPNTLERKIEKLKIVNIYSIS